jgi:hypothetical protein
MISQALLLIVLLGVTVGNLIARAEIQTCSGCKLYALPEVKKFVIDERLGALSFERVTRKILRGQNPDIVMFSDDGTEIARIDMTPYSFADLVKILENHGFQKYITDL